MEVTPLPIIIDSNVDGIGKLSSDVIPLPSTKVFMSSHSANASEENIFVLLLISKKVMYLFFTFIKA